ncbi:DUF6950 family protein [Sphingomonas canadensis]|uniref:DUF6950 family protein n=1 Tax=Sphingomonas canadensis TaxID=1219257 RepID=A0ABW3H9K4_9SPHN|nr:hypothetical protein [Sphingomonas canadensis]MCW3837799.1 hypothetical protein [Sphingomonas canadensis]
MTRLPLFERRDRTLVTCNRFLGAELDYHFADCGKMMVFHLQQMGHGGAVGHAGQWRSKLGLAKFLRRNGGSGAAVLDARGLRRIAPADAILGDLIEVPGEPPFGAFGVMLNNGAALMWSEHPAAGERCAIVRANVRLAAWRLGEFG